MALEHLYVQYGCWKDAPDGWLSYDCSPYLWIDRIPFVGTRVCRFLSSEWEPFPKTIRFGDIVKGLPLPDASCKGIYCSHVLEHLSLDELRRALANTERLLEPGGVFRMVLPDLSHYVKQYLDSSGPDAAPNFMRATGLGEVTRNRGFKGLAKELLGGSRHRWMWDYSSLELELVNAGFDCVRRAQMGDSVDARFCSVERPDRWRNCLGVECMRLPK